MLRKLTSFMAPTAANLKPAWRVAECLGTYYRPNFENLMYPYCPAHVARPKEIKHIMLVNLPEKCYLAVGGLPHAYV
jgi:cleavage and polyadenylation specificity factor subunit 5